MLVRQTVPPLSLQTISFFFCLLPYLFLTGVSGFLTSVDCHWPDGSDSNGRIPCNPNAERSACCLGSEVCLENNLCFGGVGLVYRSACAGGWSDNETCPEFCNDIIPNKWANIWPCPGRGDEGPTKFWCGTGAVCDTRATFNSSFFPIENYKFQARAIIGGQAGGAVASAIASSTTAIVTPTASPTNCPESDGKKVLTVGAGVGVPLALLALALGTWAIVERRKRKSGADPMAYSGVNDALHPPTVGMYDRQGHKAELSSTGPYRTNEDPSLRRHELQ